MDEGVQFRGRSSTAAGRAVFARAAAALDPASGAEVAAVEDWRAGYVDVVRALTPSPLAVARAGLEALREQVVDVRDGVEHALGAAPPRHGVETVTLPGGGPRVRELVLPVGGELLRGDALRRRLEAWVRDGVVEPGCAEAVLGVAAEPDRLALEGRTIVLLGAGAEMGPLEPLAAWGADVVAIDLPSQRARVQALAQAGSGRVRLPGAGADLRTALPEVAAWLAGLDAERPVVASHGYADGARHVLVAAATDALVAGLPGAGFAALATPTDAWVVPPEAVAHARSRWERRRPASRVLRAVSGGRLLRPAYADAAVADGVVPQQGANYALAKRVQRWRAAVAAAEGRAISWNLAPATTTRSVTRNRVLAAAYAGARHFGVEVFAPATTRVLMAALLVADLHRDAPPADPDAALARNAAHGGLWRVPYELRSALGIAALLGLPRTIRR